MCASEADADGCWWTFKNQFCRSLTFTEGKEERWKNGDTGREEGRMTSVSVPSVYTCSLPPELRVMPFSSLLQGGVSASVPVCSYFHHSCSQTCIKCSSPYAFEHFCPLCSNSISHPHPLPHTSVLRGFCVHHVWIELLLGGCCVLTREFGKGFVPIVSVTLSAALAVQMSRGVMRIQRSAGQRALQQIII